MVSKDRLEKEETNTMAKDRLEMDEMRVFRHSFQIDVETGTATEIGDPIQTSETAKRIYRKIFDRLKDKTDWRRQTQRMVVESWTEAQLVSEALTYFLGGAEVEAHVLGGYTVGSKGYYHYMKQGHPLKYY